MPKNNKAGSAPPLDSTRDVIAAVLAQAIAAVQSQQVPSEQALRNAMASLGAAQRAALDLLLEATQAQAQVVRQLLDNAPAATRNLGTEVGSLLASVLERSPEIIDSVSTGFTSWLTAFAGPAKAQSKSSAATVSAVPTNTTAEQKPAAQPEPVAEPEPLEAILGLMAEGYSAGRTGSEVAETIRLRYPAAADEMRKYLAMDDFLVLLWLRQQPTLANVAVTEGFPKFYAELKAAMM